MTAVKPYNPRKTKVWTVGNINNDIWIGLIEWCNPWRQYCFFPRPETVFSAGCLDDLSDFLKTVNADHKK